jgi:hypothetical protein
MRPNFPLPQIARPVISTSKLCQDHDPAADAHLVTLLKGRRRGALKLATWEFALGGPRWEHA